MNINKTDHYLLAARGEKRRRGANSLELALIVIGIVAVIGLSSLLL